MLRREVLLGSTLIALASGGTAQAAEPRFNRPITLIVPFAAGNTADIVARILSEKLAQIVRQPVIVDNRAGGGGMMGTSAVARAAADGYTLLLTTPSPLVLNPVIYRRLPYDPVVDLVPLGIVSSQPMILLASRELGVTGLVDFIARARAANPDLAYASVGQGTYSHFAIELLLSRVGARGTHVPYRGAAAAQTDLMADRVSFMLDGFATGYEQVKGGNVVGLAVTSLERVAAAPELPTFAESGIAGLEDFEVSGWVGLFAPRGTPEPIVGFYERAVNEILGSGGVRDRLLKLNMAPVDRSSSDRLRAAVLADSAKWREVARAARIEPRD